MIARKPIKIFTAVINALFMREMSMRITSGKSGLFWTFFDPFIQVFIYSAIHAIAFKSRGTLDYGVFIAVNYIAFFLFRNIIKKSIATFSANKALFVYKQVKPIDTIIARALVELYITAIVVVIFLILSYYLKIDLKIKDLPMVVFGVLWLMFFGISFGLLIAVGNFLYQSIGKLIGIAMMFLLFTSAIFFYLDSLPSTIREILLINPVVHFMELIHGSFFYELDTKYVNYNYMILWTFGTLFLGMLLYRRYEKRIISS